MKIESTELQQQLFQFGLNPKEWNIEKRGPNTYVIRHCQDLKIYFWGIIRKSDHQMEWKKLHIAI